MKFSIKMLLLAMVLIIVNMSILIAQAQTRTDLKCKHNPSLGFFPKAFTLVSVNVRAQIPEYSLLKGQWIQGERVDILSPNTCLAILERKMVGVIQIWYRVKYQKEGRIRTGWVWGGTKDVDDTQYIGGDKTPEKQGEEQSLFKTPLRIPSLSLFANLAHAQTDRTAIVSREGQTSFGPVAKDEKVDEYLWKVPILNWTMNSSAASAIFLFMAMVVGMFAKALWDQTEAGSIIPPLAKVLRPFLISPIAFSAFWGPMYIQQGSGGISLTMALYAFQIGFMWQHVLEKRLATGLEPKSKG